MEQMIPLSTAQLDSPHPQLGMGDGIALPLEHRCREWCIQWEVSALVAGSQKEEAVEAAGSSATVAKSLTAGAGALVVHSVALVDDSQDTADILVTAYAYGPPEKVAPVRLELRAVPNSIAYLVA